MLALSALIAAVPASASPVAGTVVNSHEFFLGEIHTPGHAYSIAAWVGGLPDDAASTRIHVKRFTWSTAEWLSEDATVDELALRMTNDGGIATIRFQADLPLTGRFDVVLSSARLSTRQWVGTGSAAAFVGERAAETTYGPDQTAGGATGLVIQALWGIRGHGIIRTA